PSKAITPICGTSRWPARRGRRCRRWRSSYSSGATSSPDSWPVRSSSGANVQAGVFAPPAHTEPLIVEADLQELQAIVVVLPQKSRQAGVEQTDLCRPARKRDVAARRQYDGRQRASDVLELAIAGPAPGALVIQRADDGGRVQGIGRTGCHG